MVILILAGSHDQADYYIRKNGLDPRSYIYLHSASQLRGRRGMIVWYYGTYYKRADIDEIERAIKYTQCGTQTAPNSE